MKKILVVNVNWMGDVIFSSPVFRALKEAYPQSTIYCLAVPRVKEIVERISGVDKMIIYDEEGRHRAIVAKLKLIREIRKEKFDAVFLLHRSLTRSLMVFLAGIPKRVGFDTKARGLFLTHKVKFKSDLVHRSDMYLQVIEALGIEVKDRTTSVSVDENSLAEIEQKLKSCGFLEKDRLIVIHPGANWELKRWPAGSFARLIDQLLLDPSVKVVIAGSKDDEMLVHEITRHLSSKPIILTGQTSLTQLMALMSKAEVVISADSGPLHLASSVGAKVVALFGPTRPEVTGPRGIGPAVALQQDVGCNRQPCYHLQCQDNICMQALTINHVLDAVKQISNS